MANPWYVAVEKFGPEAGSSWVNYLQWSQLLQLKELVTLDNILCPDIIKELTAEEWQHNVQKVGWN